MHLFRKLPLLPLVLLTATLGLAPFTPEPHLWEKLKMAFAGTLTRPVDIFDLCLHGTPFVLLALRLTLPLKREATPTNNSAQKL